MDKWHPELAFRFVARNSDVKQDKSMVYGGSTYFVKRGPAGNGVLGAIDYLNGHSNYDVYVISEEKFAAIK